MGVQEIDGKWHTVNKHGKVGKRGFSTKANAEAASARGQSLQTGRTSTKSSLEGAGLPTTDRENPDTADERRRLGVPPKRVPKDPEAF